MTIVPIISPIPVTKPGISIFCIIRLRIISFRYGRSFVVLSYHGRTTTPKSENLSHTGKVFDGS